MKQFYLFALLLLGITSFAQSYTFTYYNTNSGLQSNNVNDFKISSVGTIWIATNSGLSSMVGNSITNYNTNNSQIPYDGLNKVAVSPNNTIWMSTYQVGLIRFANNVWTSYTMANSSIPNNVINGIATDSSNNIWVATPSGLAKFNGTTWTTYTTATTGFGFSNDVSSVFTDGAIVYYTAGNVLYKLSGSTFTMLTDGASKIVGVAGGKIYMSTGDGLFIYTSPNVQEVFWTNSSCLADCGINAADVDENNKVWLGLYGMCNNGGVQRFSDCVTYTNENSPFPDHYVTSIDVLNSNVIWIGTQENGLVKMTLADGCAQPTNLVDEVTSFSTAKISWNYAYPVPSGYKYRYSTSSTPSGTIVSTSNLSASLTGLTPSTTYYWWATSNCEPFQWVSGGSFTTSPQADCYITIARTDTNSFAISGDNYLWGWGNGGKFGIGSQASFQLPTKIGTSTWKAIASSTLHSMGIKSDGTLWTTGNNTYGQLGDGTNSNKTTWIQIGNSSNWKQVAAGQLNSLAIKEDGSLWSWGNNEDGQVGDGTVINRNVPVRIGTANNWVAVGGGYKLSVAMKSDGTLWTWGQNNSGPLGNPAINFSHVPQQVGTATDWKTFAAGAGFVLAVKNDGRLFAWGLNAQGALGIGSTQNKFSPTQVGTATNWDKVYANFHSGAITTTGDLYMWGENAYGGVGDGTITDRTTPVQVGAGTVWKALGMGWYHTIGLKADGTLMGWGVNEGGTVGDGTLNQRLSPVNIQCSFALSNQDFETPAEIEFYPNPVSTAFKVDYNGGTITAMTIYDIKGAVVKTIKSDFNSEINIAELPSGLYLLNIVNDKGNSLTKRLLKK